MTIWVWWHEAGRCHADDAIEWGGEDVPEYIPDCYDSFPGRWRKFQEVERRCPVCQSTFRGNAEYPCDTNPNAWHKARP